MKRFLRNIGALHLRGLDQSLPDMMPQWYFESEMTLRLKLWQVKEANIFGRQSWWRRKTNRNTKIKKRSRRPQPDSSAIHIYLLKLWQHFSQTVVEMFCKLFLGLSMLINVVCVCAGVILQHVWPFDLEKHLRCSDEKFHHDRVWAETWPVPSKYMG